MGRRRAHQSPRAVPLDESVTRRSPNQSSKGKKGTMPNLDIVTLTPKEELDAYLNNIEHLPPAPTLMVQLIELFRKPDADVDEIVVLLKRDPALSLEVLRRCNNAFFG